MLSARRFVLIVICFALVLGALGSNRFMVNAATEYALQFDGVDDRVTFGAASGLGAQTFTLETWFMRTGPGAGASTGTGGLTSAVPLVTKGRGEADGNNKDMNYFLGIDTARRVLAADFEDMAGGINHPVFGKTPICDNIWYHAAATYDGATWRLYLNGELEVEQTVGTPGQFVPRFDSIQHAALGSALTSDGTAAGFFKGQLDEARIWNVARSQAAVNLTRGVPLPLSQPNLVGRWGLDEGTGTLATNSAGAPNGTLTSTSPATPLVWVAGGSTYTSGLVPGLDGLRLSGTTGNADYVTFGPAPALGAAKFTIETWFKRDGTGVTTSTGSGGLATALPLVTKGRAELEASNVDMNYFLGINVNGATNVLAADFEEGATGTTPGLNHPILGVTPIVLNTWYHAAVTYDGVNLQLYLNGVPDGPALFVGQPPRADSIQHAALGTAMTSTGASAGFFAGTLDEARIWNYGRSPQQILAAATREIPNAFGLLARWSFNDCCGRVVDSTGHLPNGTVNGLGWSWVARGASNPLLTAPNLPPTVIAAGPASVQLPASASISGSITDTDGINTGTPLSALWTKVSGPGTVTFGSSTSPITTAGFSAPGSYVLMLTGSDGELSAASSITIDVTAGPVNLPPTANAGADQTVTFPAAASLFGTYADDGLPGVDVETAWSVVNGPGTVSIAQSQELATTATFSSPGVYVLRLTANDGALSGSDTVTITVSPASSNTAVDLNGSSAFVALGQAPGLGSATFTLEAWFKREGAGVATSTGSGGVTAIPLVTKGMAQADNSNVDMNYFLGIRSSDGVLAADFEDTAGGGNHPVFGTTAIPANGVWHHAAVTYSGTTWRVYLDGVQETELVVGNFTPRADSIQHAAIGSALGSNGVVPSGQTQGFFNGVIDEVRIWNIARTATDIQNGMSTEITSAPNLAGRWGFNEGAGAAAADGSGHSLNGTISATFSWVPGVPFNATTNHAPDQPIVNGPGNPAAGVKAPATLDVTVSDADADKLTVTYYARPKFPTPPDFTYVTIPDTQHYVDNTTFPVTFTLQTNWIIANRDSMNIAFVSQLGDLTEHGDAAEIEWQRASSSMSVLDLNAMPYGAAPGNHDQNNSGVANFYDQYFPLSRFQVIPGFGGYLGADADDPINRLSKNNYELFSVGGLDFLVIHIELDWPDYSVAWADKIIKRYPNRRVILSSHAFLNTSNARPTAAQFRANGTSAEAVWQQIVKPNCNVFMVVNGHYPGEGRRTDLNNCGQPVHQVLMDYQSRANGGDGWLRYFVFKPSENKIYAYTYSVTQHAFETDDSSQFVLDYNLSGTPFTVLAANSDVTSGARSTASYPGLVPGTQYEWYVTVSDGKTTTTSPVSTFTAAAPNTAPVAAGDSYSVNEDEVLTVPAPGVLGNDTDGQADPLTVALVSGPAHGVLSLNPNGSFSYAPSANYSGSDSFTYRANDGAADSNVATVTITVTPVNDVPVAAGDSYSTDEDTPLTVPAAGVLSNDTDLEGGTLHAALVAGPAHGAMTLNTDGSLTYVPSANYNGPDSFTYRANDGQGDSNVATVAITVKAVNDAPVAGDDGYSTDEDTALTVPAAGVLGNDSDIESSPLHAVLVSGPSHGALILNADGSFSYTPAANYSGPDSFSYRANDGEADSAAATVAIAVKPVNDAPVAGNDSYSTDEDTLLTIAAGGVLGNDSDIESSPLHAVLVSGPSHGALTLNADGSFSYTPAANYNGPDGFSYRANDGEADSAAATVSITVKAVNDAPQAAGDSYSTAEDTALTIPAAGVLGNDTDVDSSALSALLVSGPAHGTLTLNPDGGFTYTPSANYSGPDSFTYRVNDGETDSAAASVAMTVTPVNDAPVAGDDSYSTNEDTALTIAAGVLGNDTDVEGSALHAVLVSGPSHGTLTLNADGSFSYTPAADYNGPDSFSYRANDDEADSNVATVAITVTAVNDAPVAAGDSYSTDEDTALTIPAAGVLGNDTDGESSALHAVLASGPSHGTLTLNADGSFTYTPSADFNGADSFSYRANDGDADSNVATVTIAVKPVNDAPAAVADSYSTDEDRPLTIAAAGVLGNDSDADGQTLHAALVTGPAHGTLTLNADGSFTYTPAADYSGADSFTYRANDGEADSGVATVALTVKPVNDVPVAANDEYTTNEGTPITIAAPGVLGNDTDIDGGTLRAMLVTGPGDGTLTLNQDGSFTYAPAAGFDGTDSFTYRANDGAGLSNLATVTIVVRAVNDAPIAANDSYATSEDAPLTVAAAAGVLHNDSDAEGGPLQAILVNGPAQGTLTLNADGSFVYAPPSDFNGTDSFTYRTSDGTAVSNEALVVIAVGAVNDAPVAFSQSVTTLKDTAITIALVAEDEEGSPLTYRVVRAPAHGTLSGSGKSLKYTPAKKYIGSDSFSFVANDGQADSDPAVVSIAVASTRNQPPVALNQRVDVDEDTRETFTLTADDADGDTLRFRIIRGPRHGTLRGEGATLRYTPDRNFNGLDRIVFQAYDKKSESNLAVVTFVVAPVNDRPEALDLHVHGSGDGPVTGRLFGWDVDRDKLTFRLVDAPNRGSVTINATTGKFTYTPDRRRGSQSDTFDFVVNDGHTDSRPATVKVELRKGGKDH
jgi:VCBS repeat-containing protein